MADSTNTVTEAVESDNVYIRTITVTGSSKPNLTPYQPSGWSSPIVVSTMAGTHVDSTVLRSSDRLYIDWSVLNNGTAATGARYLTALKIDGTTVQEWFTDPPQSPTYHAYAEDFVLGPLSAGSHTLTIVADTTAAISESNEGDNTYSRTIVIGGVDVVAQRAHLKTAVGGSEVDSPAVGERVFLYGDLQVTGSGNSVTVPVRLVLDGVPLCSCSITATPGQSYTSWCKETWTASAGSHTLELQLDSSSSLVEEDETNNVARKTFTTSQGDTVAPAGTITINDGSTYTKSTSATLRLSATDSEGVTAYFLSVTSSRPSAGDNEWIAVASTSSFSLSRGFTLATSDGTKTVYAWYRDAAGNISSTASDAITLDQSAPANGTLTAAGGDRQIQLSWSGQDDPTSGVASSKLVFSASSQPPVDCSGVTLATSSPFTHTGLTNGQAYAYRVCTTDSAGNVSTGATASATPQGVVPPGSVVATASAGGGITITWSMVPDAARYHVLRSSNNSTYIQVNAESTTGISFVDTTAAPNTAYLYKVRSVSTSGAESFDSSRDLATAIVFEDSVLRTGVTFVRAVHFHELRTAVNAVRQLAGLPAATFSETIVQGSVVTGAHLTDLRSALNSARSALGLPSIHYEEQQIVRGSTKVKAAHLEEIRNGVR